MDCRNCYNDCHCDRQEHIDEYLDICPCNKCNCEDKKEE